MARNAATCILLAGAPEAEHLDWDGTRLLSTFDIGSQRLANCTGLDTQQPTPTWQPPTWRSIPLDPSLGLGLEKAVEDEAPQTQFLSFGAQIPDLDIVGQQDFVDHSIALLDGLVSSQIAAPAGHGHDETTFLTTYTISFDSTVSSISDPSVVQDSLPDQGQHIPSSIHLTDLATIPSAAHITGIVPQTMTINLLCAIISISAPRNVQLRRRNASMEIVEILVGDETRAGFSVSFWLAPEDSQHKPQDDVREALRPLRSGDLVLLTNIALSAFRNAVYGQSLSKRFSRNSTSVIKLGVAERATAIGVMAGKVRRVQKWAEDFVGGEREKWQDVRERGTRVRRIREQEVLPPDTQA